MNTEPTSPSEIPVETGEKQLCVGCVFPNEPEAHFCTQCGAPLTSYAATGPFESLFAEGHVYRQAAERPRRFIVVLGIWLIFGAVGMVGVAWMTLGGIGGRAEVLAGAVVLLFCLVMIAKTTWNYFVARKNDGTRGA
jgi:hypothetical protein